MLSWLAVPPAAAPVVTVATATLLTVPVKLPSFNMSASAGWLPRLVPHVAPAVAPDSIPENFVLEAELSTS